MIKVLFVCRVNRMRSLTAEHLFSNDPRFEVKSAGVKDTARVPVTRELLEWADYILVMEKSHRNKIREKYEDIYQNKRIINLEIPDIYPYMDERLQNLLKIKMNEIFGNSK